MAQPTMAQRQSYDFCLSVTLFNHRDQTQRVEQFLESLNEAFELDGITQDRVKINVLRQRVEQVTRRLLPTVAATETFQSYSTKIRNAFPSSYSDTLASDKYYKFKFDMKSFEESLLQFEHLAEIVLANYPEADKLNSIKDRLKCQLASYKDLYEYVRDFDGNPVTLFRDLIHRYEDEKIRRQTANAGKFSRYTSFSRFKSIKCYHCQILGHTSDQCKRKKQGAPPGDYSRRPIKTEFEGDATGRPISNEVHLN
uniref:CCHC-type domain-containing protein n=1 Tax=Strongyloides papillosus TaxID=174720 RepID=A0A0N5C4R2_STREA